MTQLKRYPRLLPSDLMLEIKYAFYNSSFPRDATFEEMVETFIDEVIPYGLDHETKKAKKEEAVKAVKSSTMLDMYKERTIKLLDSYLDFLEKNPEFSIKPRRHGPASKQTQTKPNIPKSTSIKKSQGLNR